MVISCGRSFWAHVCSRAENSTSRFLLDVHTSLNQSLLKYLICGRDSLSCRSVSHIYRSDWLRGVLCERAAVIGRFTVLWWPIWWNGGKCDEPALCRGGWTLAIIPSIASHPSPPYSLSLIPPPPSFLLLLLFFLPVSCLSTSVFHFCLPYPSLFPAPPFFLTSRSAAPGLFGCW